VTNPFRPTLLCGRPGRTLAWQGLQFPRQLPPLLFVAPPSPMRTPKERLAHLVGARSVYRTLPPIKIRTTFASE
jgi:hypothetical protein